MMRSTRLAVVLTVGAACGSAGAPPVEGARSGGRPAVLLAVFAHPDDELTVGPILARYARAGTRVHLVVVTDGAAGVEEHAGIPAGEALARVRRQEIECAARELGIQTPILYGFPDGQLGMTASAGTTAGRLSAKELERVAARLRETIATIQPDVIITWGPEGGYGHPDHRLVGDIVTQEVQAAGSPRLYFPGWTREEIARSRNKLLQLWYPIAARLVRVRIRYQAQDLDRAMRALRCHRSQFAPDMMEGLVRGLTAAWNGEIGLQPWFGAGAGNEL